MKKFCFIILILFFNHVSAFAQSCLPDGIIFTKQSQIDSFQINYPNCTVIEGSVIISGNDISNLNELSVLTTIQGDLKIEYNDSLIQLTGLNNLTSIGGDLRIGVNDALTSLSGLAKLTHIGRHLFIGYWDAWVEYVGNPSLTNLTGLEGLTYLNGGLYIYGNVSLTSLKGLNNITNIGDEVMIEANNALTSLNGLESLTSITGTIYIGENYFGGGNQSLTSLSGLNNLTNIGENFRIGNSNSLTNLKGLENLNSIGGFLHIWSNDALNSLTGLNGLTSIGGDLRIDKNKNLTSLTGLENIESGSIINLRIRFNYLLSNCHIDCICKIIKDPHGTVEIHHNGINCDGQEEITTACKSSYLPDGIIFKTQDQIDNFRSDYPGCSHIEGSVVISETNGNSISNLLGLSNLTSIGGNLRIEGNDAMNSLSGLDNLVYIGGSLSLKGNSILTNFAELDNLISIGGDLEITENVKLTGLTGLNSVIYIGGNLWITGNSSLINLTGLINANYINGDLLINKNDALKSLAGLDNIDANFIDNIIIHDNSSLFYCEVQSLCNYLASSKGTVEVRNNASGCNSSNEIANACGILVSENIVMLRKESEIKDLQIQQSRIFLIGMGVFVVIIGFMALLFIRLNKVRAHHKSVVLEQKLLRLQMNPHFLFNSLADLQGFIWSKDTLTANEYLSSFSKLLRLILENSRQEFVPVEKEISAITHYLKLQSLRYKDKFEYNIHIDEEIEEEDMLIPPMLAQPFIENAIEHGIMPKESTGHIEVNFVLDKNLINIEVTDDGIGFKRSSELKETKHPGQESLAMTITRERLTMIYKKYKQKIRFNISDIIDDKNNVAGARVSFAVPFSRI